MLKSAVICLALFLGGSATASPLMGIEVNLPPEGFEGYAAAFEKAYQAGNRNLRVSPIWREFEHLEGQYEYSNLDTNVKLASKYSLPVYLNLRIIDTHKKALPDYLSSNAFSDPEVEAALYKTLAAIAAHAKGTVRWVSIGNEADSYLLQHKEEIDGYTRLVSHLKPKIKELFKQAEVTVNITFGSIDQLNGALKPLYEISDFVSLTYYPLNPDFSLREPEVASQDIKVMVKKAGGKKVFLQEVGYYSEVTGGGSQEKQAAFVQQVFDTVALYDSQVIGVSFLWMYDLDSELVRQFSDYYSVGGNSNFSSFLGSLGFVNRKGEPKLAWETFRKNASAAAKMSK